MDIIYVGSGTLVIGLICIIYVWMKHFNSKKKPQKKLEHFAKKNLDRELSPLPDEFYARHPHYGGTVHSVPPVHVTQVNTYVNQPSSSNDLATGILIGEMISNDQSTISVPDSPPDTPAFSGFGGGDSGGAGASDSWSSSSSSTDSSSSSGYDSSSSGSFDSGFSSSDFGS
jgi:uncharacterized membrane protein YgcG